jgi:hypothetical protein
VRNKSREITVNAVGIEMTAVKMPICHFLCIKASSGQMPSFKVGSVFHHHHIEFNTQVQEILSQCPKCCWGHAKQSQTEGAASVDGLLGIWKKSYFLRLRQPNPLEIAGSGQVTFSKT